MNIQSKVGLSSQMVDGDQHITSTSYIVSLFMCYCLSSIFKDGSKARALKIWRE